MRRLIDAASAEDCVMAASKSSQQRKRVDAFRLLLVRVSEKLDDEDVEKIGFIYRVQGEKKNGLDVLRALERRRIFSATNTEPLVKMMRNINRLDIEEDVKRFLACRRASFSAQTPPMVPIKPRNRSRTESQVCNIKITVSSPDQDQSTVHTPPSNSDNHRLSVPQSAHDTGHDGRAVYPERAPQPISEAFTESDMLISEAPAEDQPGSDSGDCRSDSNGSQPSQEDDSTTRRHNSDSQIVRIGLTVNMPSYRSKSFDRLHCETQRHKPPSKRLSFPNKEQAANGHPPLTTSQSAPGDMYQVQTPDKSLQGSVTAKADTSSGLMMKLPADKGEIKEPHTSLSKQPPNEDHDSHRDVSHWKILESSSQRGRGGRKVSGKGLERTTKCMWDVERESVLKSIWNHQHHDSTQCRTPVPIDIECGPHNPHVSLQLYHYGLFEDANKSMTLHVKVVIPDNCPPLPTDATFTLTWEVHAVTKLDTKKLEGSKKPIKVRFGTGVFYIHKLLPHSVLQQNKCEMLKISVHLTTAYSIRGDYTFSYISQKCADEMLLSVKKIVGNRKISQEIGQAYRQFGRSLLNDEDGTITDGIAAETNNDAVAINDQIFSLWLQGQGRHPVQWSTLIHTLREIDMHDLASHMEHNLNS